MYYKMHFKIEILVFNSVSNVTNYTDSELLKPKEATEIWIKYEQIRRLENKLDANCLLLCVLPRFLPLSTAWEMYGIHSLSQRKSSKHLCYKLDNYFLETVLAIPYSYPVCLAHY